MPGRVAQLLDQSNKKHLARLIDPEKETDMLRLAQKCKLIAQSSVDFIFIGASSLGDANSMSVSKLIKNHCPQPLIGFPGSASQLNPFWYGMLYISLIGSKNAQYLFEEQNIGTQVIEEMDKDINIYPSAYLIVDGGRESSAAKTTNSQAICASEVDEILLRCKTASFLGMQNGYLEAGSGAIKPIHLALISKCSKDVDARLIVGGGIKTVESALHMWEAGAEVLVIGNHFEEHPEKISDYCAVKDRLNQKHA